MRKKSTIAIHKLMFYYCIYQLSLKVNYKDPRRCDRYNLLLNMIIAIQEIQNDGQMYQDILFDYYEDGEDCGQSIASSIMQTLSNLDLGIWETRKDENGELYLYEEIYDDIVKKINIKEILSFEYVDKLKDLKAEEEMRMSNLENEYEEVPYGHIK